MKKYIFAVMAFAASVLVGCKDDKKEPKMDLTPTTNVVAVDLGLSVKWASMNVGATAPEDNGAYFAWGETTPKDDYTWSTYKLCHGSSSTFMKYCLDSSIGSVDNKTVLDLEDDAAHVNWGGEWRMPTKAEQDELRNLCDWEWTNDYNDTGAKGYIVSSRTNSNSIFLPAAGSQGDSSIYGVGSIGYYWSSSLNNFVSYYAYYLDFNSDGMDWYRCYRYYGQSVRPVCK